MVIDSRRRWLLIVTPVSRGAVLTLIHLPPTSHPYQLHTASNNSGYGRQRHDHPYRTSHSVTIALGITHVIRHTHRYTHIAQSVFFLAGFDLSPAHFVLIMAELGRFPAVFGLSPGEFSLSWTEFGLCPVEFRPLSADSAAFMDKIGLLSGRLDPSQVEL